MALTKWTEADRFQVNEDLGREPRGVVKTAARCVCGRALVVATAPRLPDGTPFPTTFYLTSPALVSACSTLEAEHFMEDLNQQLADDPTVAEAYLAAHQDFLGRRSEIGEMGGVGEVDEIAGISAGGMPSRVKCLHALVAHSLAAGPGVNPMGDRALEELETRGMWTSKRCDCEG